jgi:hypothetical protein
MPAMSPAQRRAGPGQWIALAGAAVAVAVIIALVASWPSHTHRTVGAAAASSPPDTPVAAAPAPAAPAAQRVVHVRHCDPVYGGGVPHRVTSSAGGGAPAGCGEAHSVLLDSLNGGNRVGVWHCTRSPNRDTLAACTSAGGRRIVARD